MEQTLYTKALHTLILVFATNMLYSSDQLIEIEQGVYQATIGSTTYTLELGIHPIFDEATITIFDEQETKCGSITYTTNDEPSIDWLEVFPGFQKRGLGRMLFEGACKHLKALGHSKATWVASLEVVEFYKKLNAYISDPSPIRVIGASGNNIHGYFMEIEL